MASFSYHVSPAAGYTPPSQQPSPTLSSPGSTIQSALDVITATTTTPISSATTPSTTNPTPSPIPTQQEESKEATATPRRPHPRDRLKVATPGFPSVRNRAKITTPHAPLPDFRRVTPDQLRKREVLEARPGRIYQCTCGHKAKLKINAVAHFFCNKKY